MKAVQVGLTFGLLAIGWVTASEAATTCTGQYGTCFSMCRQYGFGRHRADHPHPQSAATCRNHCIDWKTACLWTGCWNADLVQVCGLLKR
jgi:hypothetical protein